MSKRTGQLEAGDVVWFAGREYFITEVAGQNQNKTVLKVKTTEVKTGEARILRLQLGTRRNVRQLSFAEFKAMSEAVTRVAA